LILAHGFPLELAKLLRQQPAEQEKSMEDLQRENIGIDWIGAGEWLAHRWHLPEGVSQIIASLANHECDSEYNLDSCLIQGASLWLRKSADGESVALSNIEALQEVPGLDKDVLVKVEEKFLGESEELHVLSRLLS
jgi:HD-like signal output (HDOD) protein